MDVQVETERHPFRFLFKFLIVAGILFAASRFLAQQKEQWKGLSESQARAKVESKLGPRIGEDKASEIAQQVVSALAEAGVIKRDPAKEAVEDLADKAKDVVDKVKDAAEKVKKD